jgi:hypothetical protein
MPDTPERKSKMNGKKWYCKAAVYENGCVKLLEAGPSERENENRNYKGLKSDIHVDVFDTEKELIEFIKTRGFTS